MNSETQDLLTQKLENMIFDEDKIVTLLSAASTFDLNIQDTKKLLAAFISDYRKVNSEDLAVTYVISGVLKSDQLSVQLVKESELPTVRDLFREVSGENLYSIQKCKDVDLHAISLVDSFDAPEAPEKPPLGAIIGKNCVKRELKKSKPLPPAPKQPVIKGKSSFFVKTEPQTEKTQPSSKSEVKKDSESEIKPAVKSSKPQEKVGKSEVNIEKKGSKSEAKSEAKGNSGKGIADFFAKIPQKSVKPSSDSNSEESKNEETDSVVVTEASEVFDDDSVIQATPQEEKPKRKPSQKKRQRSKTNSEQATKRRKRIVETNDSDSDDIFGNACEDEEEKMESKPDLDDSPPWVKTVPDPLPPKNKRRKLVDKTYQDEDGFILTKKEWVYESGSEDEKDNFSKKVEATLQPKPETNLAQTHTEEVKTKPESKAKKGKKAVAANQPTLMSFFKKK